MLPAQPLWTPSDQFVKHSRLTAFADYIRDFEVPEFEDYDALWRWSVANPAQLWEFIWRFFDVQPHDNYQQSYLRPDDGRMIGTEWFEGATLNYAEHVFRHKNTDRPAVIYKSETRHLTHIFWSELEAQVAKVADFLRESGVGRGDRVVAYLPNIPEALVAFLAANSLGAVWSSCSPDFGASAVLDRFQQIQPKVLIACDGYTYNGKVHDRTDTVTQLAASMPTLKQLVVVPYLAKLKPPQNLPTHTLWTDLLRRPEVELSFEAVPFDHPIWVLYSSGTTGKPKAITHSVGGCLLEHLKALALHQDVRKGDVYFWYSTTGWMMWNYANAALLCGATVVLYDGSPAYPDGEVLYDLVEEAGINHFGAGAAFFNHGMKQGLSFVHTDKMDTLRSIGSTGSPLSPEAYRWVYQQVKPDVWLISLSGGTDVCSAFVGGCPWKPVYAGELQCRMLGAAVRAFDDDGRELDEGVGELVLTEPLPSMPIYFWNDPENQRYHDSYFTHYENVWRHGDWIRITAQGGVIIYGRSDATLNRGGVRIGTSEVYRAVESLPEIADSLVVNVTRKDGSDFMPLFVVLRSGELDDALKSRIKAQLRSQFSPRHVPDAIYVVSEIPYTISGKKMELPVKKILLGTPPERAATRDAMRNPDALAAFSHYAS